ncbi:hypothetical protein A3C67_03125 [Candidatus Nomurabacteria bacterium RIFCSPHIGHO2_02_FULL_42_19]|uniref:Uncharacterized protein n=1 Tax=Candidatus Nomurabacteria bacterium RIFCSPHIGHO2_02_FULL_42_19 TaxID=1801756 RepID=A0A1F6W2Z8_9BACT|nr:MAG: hypothetical protein A3C67_03125 [Candidatus Nomurabacteria bacterium RIFCSPHIGHO2_02_FULL_42_19]
MNKSLILSVVIIIILAGGVFYVLSTRTPAPDESAISSFEECVAAGYPVMESYPRQCRTPEGVLFVENVENPTPAPVATGGCFVGGCSGQICSDQEGVITTCEYREEYACYKSTKCERQASGQCGWTETPEFAICLNVSTGTGSDIK